MPSPDVRARPDETHEFYTRAEMELAGSGEGGAVGFTELVVLAKIVVPELARLGQIAVKNAEKEVA